jgi:hypothetical protein
MDLHSTPVQLQHHKADRKRTMNETPLHEEKKII